MYSRFASIDINESGKYFKHRSFSHKNLGSLVDQKKAFERFQFT